MNRNMKEPPLKSRPGSLSNGRRTYRVANPDGSVGFIRSELLKPVEGELNKEFAQICVRPANQGQRFIYAVKDGMILRALIAPMNIKDDVANDLDEIIGGADVQTAKTNHRKDAR